MNYRKESNYDLRIPVLCSLWRHHSFDAERLSKMETLIRKIQMLISTILEKNIIYAINPDGSVMELEPGFILLGAKRYQMEEYIKEIDIYE